MKYKLCEAQRSDAPALTSVFLDAFKDDPMVGPIWHHCDPEVRLAYQTRRFATHFDNMERDGVVYRKVIEEKSGGLVAFAKWVYPHTLTAEQKAEKEKTEANSESSPEGTNFEIMKAFFGALEEKRKQHTDHSKDFFLHLLGVSPAHQRQGLGSMLIEEGLANADARNAKTYIEASPKGLGLYLRHGWKPVDEIVIDMSNLGGNGIAREKCLLRQPGGK